MQNHYFYLISAYKTPIFLKFRSQLS